MKYISIILLIAATFVFLFSCSKKQSSNANVNDESSVSITDLSDSPAYQRGMTVGRSIAGLPEGSREREKALIEVHGMVSALERGGFKKSAAHFAQGVAAAL